MIELRNVSFAYEKNQPTLKHISLKLGEDNENIVGIIGPNGSGKSTLFLNLVGMLKPSDGEIVVDGSPIKYGKHALNELRKKIGIVFQNSDQQIFIQLFKMTSHLPCII